jgi:hypothetical protein
MNTRQEQSIVNAHLYVYFKIPDAAADDLLPRWWHWLETVSSATGIVGALRRRPGTGGDGSQTWMEIYENVPASWADTLDELWAASDLERFLVGGRHSELFTDLPRSGEGG